MVGPVIDFEQGTETEVWIIECRPREHVVLDVLVDYDVVFES
jgi:hypothetical protein